ncbi:MAG: F0F1 ATP synthase subunit gamma [Acidimicrobiia bacterium]
MAGGQERVLRRRIHSVQSTRKITRAMELIAASRIVRAQARVAAAVPYSDLITEVVRDLGAASTGVESPLLTRRPEIARVGHVVLTADRGLCGAYNSAVIRAAEGSMREQDGQGRDYALFLVGRKAESYFRYRNFRIDATFSGFSDQPSYEDARTIADAVRESYLEGRVDLVELIYTRFISAGKQEVVVRPLMPLDRDVVLGGDAKPSPTATAAYEFEPSPEVILERLLPRYAEARVYAALLNAAASEHAARQRAMKSATDNADDLMTSLRRVMNRARQDAITTEIMEVVGGAEALRQGKHPHAEDVLVDAVDGSHTRPFAIPAHEN